MEILGSTLGGRFPGDLTENLPGFSVASSSPIAETMVPHLRGKMVQSIESRAQERHPRPLKIFKSPQRSIGAGLFRLRFQDGKKDGLRQWLGGVLISG